VWVWTNLLAHGSEESLVAERRVAPFRMMTAEDRWHAARSYLAGEVLDLAEHYGPLLSLQRNVLVPLELQFASDPAVSSWGPRQWVESVRRKLAEHCRACQREERRTLSQAR